MGDDFEAALTNFKQSKVTPPQKSAGEPNPSEIRTEDLQREQLKTATESIIQRRKEFGWKSRRSSDGKRVLALLFIIIESLPHEDVWRSWIDGPGSEEIDVRVWIHAKNRSDLKSEWVKSKLIDSWYAPKWGSIDITRAMIDLAETALSDPEVGRLSFVSESCIPLVPLNEAGFQLWREENSWLNYSFEPSNGYDTIQKWHKMSIAIEKSSIAKSDQWLVLTRGHAEEVFLLDQKVDFPLWTLMQSVIASDEMYFSTALSLLGELGPQAIQNYHNAKENVEAPDPNGEAEDLKMKEEAEKENNSSVVQESVKCTLPPIWRVQKRRMTWCDWSESPKNPVTLKSFDPSGAAVKSATEEGCLFGRKWAPGSVPLEEFVEWNKKRGEEFSSKLEGMDASEKETALNFIASGSPPPELDEILPLLAKKREETLRNLPSNFSYQKMNKPEYFDRRQNFRDRSYYNGGYNNRAQRGFRGYNQSFNRQNFNGGKSDKSNRETEDILNGELACKRNTVMVWESDSIKTGRRKRSESREGQSGSYYKRNKF